MTVLSPTPIIRTIMSLFFTSEKTTHQKNTILKPEVQLTEVRTERKCY